MAVPTATVRIDWDNDGSFGLPAIDDVTSRVLSDGLSWTRGRSADFSGEATGQAQFTLRNDDDRFTPDRNWCDNPSFEAGTAGWSTAAIAGLINASTSFAQVTDNAPSAGTKAGEIVCGTTAYAGVTYAIPYTFRNGVTYSLSLYAKSVSGAVHSLFGLASAGTPADLGLVETDITTSWVKYSATWTPSADRADAVVFVERTAASAATVRIDAVQVNPGAVANTYFEAPTKGQLVPGRPVHIYATYSATDYGCFYGYIQRLAPDPRARTVAITCYDVLQRMSETDVAVATFSAAGRTARDYRMAILEDYERGDRNLVWNPSFETNTTGWTVEGSGSSITRITTDGAQGTCCGEWVSGTGAPVRLRYSSDALPVFPKDVPITFSAYLRTTAGTASVELKVETFGTRTVTVTTTWTRYYVTAILTSQASGLVLEISNPNPTGSITVRVDGVAATRGRALLAYADAGTGRWPNWVANGSFDCYTSTGWYDAWTNLIGNPSFESDTSGWSGAGDAFVAAATFTRAATDAKYGSAHGNISSGSSGQVRGAYYAITGTFKQGATYAFRVWVKLATSALETTAGIGSNGTPTDKAQVLVYPNTNEWTEATGTWTPSADRADAHFYVGRDSGTFDVKVDGAFVTGETAVGLLYSDTGPGGGGSFVTTFGFSTAAKYGSGCLVLTTPTATKAGCVYKLSTEYDLIFKSGVPYTLSLWLRATDAMPYKVGIGGDKGDGTWDETSTTGTLTANTWTQVTLTWTPTADRTAPNSWLYVWQTNATARTFDIDGVRLIPANAADEFEMPQWALGAEGDGIAAAGGTGTASSMLATVNGAVLTRHWITPALATPWYTYCTSGRAGLAGKTSSETYNDDLADMSAAEIDRDSIVNIVAVTDNAATRYYSDEASILQYGVRPGAAISAATMLYEALSNIVGPALVARYKDPRARPKITVVNRFPSQLARELDDLVTVNFARLGIVSGKYLVAAMSTTVSQNGNWWETVYQLEEYPY